MLDNKIITATLFRINKHLSNFLLLYNYKFDENILKPQIQRNILLIASNKEIKLIIYYNKFKTTTLVINNNSSYSIEVLQKI